MNMSELIKNSGLEFEGYIEELEGNIKELKESVDVLCKESVDVLYKDTTITNNIATHLYALKALFEHIDWKLFQLESHLYSNVLLLIIVNNNVVNKLSRSREYLENMRMTVEHMTN